LIARNTLLSIGVGLAAEFGGCWVAPSRLDAQAARPTGVLDGMVSDTNLVALGEATVSVLGSSIRVTTGENGHFRVVAFPPGQYILTVHRVGYVPVASAIQIRAADTLRLSFAMRRIATELDTVVVTAKAVLQRMAGFEERRKLGFGTFLTRDQIESRSAIYVSDLLRVIPNITIVEGLRGEIAYNTRFTNCLFQFFVDEVLMPTPLDLHLLPSPRDIAGIEVYFGPATIPLQYKPANSGCGVILIWTK
jgi:carboxypeptidase family protein